MNSTVQSTAGRARPLVAAILVLLAARAVADSSLAPVRYDIPAQDAASALLALASVSRLTLAAAAADLKGIQTRAVVGDYTPDEALRLMLADTALVATVTGEGRITVSRARPVAAMNADTVLAQLQPQVRPTEPRRESADIPAAGDDPQLDEVVVTARMRSENLQEVPLSITAISGDQLQRANVQSLRDVANLTPGLTLQGDDSEREQRPTIRGLSFDGTYGDESNVATFLDGIYLSNPNAVSLGIIDFERIEVVKGPVSALYGRNAFSGAINYVSRQPSDARELRVELTAASRNRYKALASASGPLVEGVLGARLTAGYDTYDGGYEDDVNGTQLGGFEKKNADLALRYTPTERITLTAGFYYGDDSFDMPPLVRLTRNCAPGPAGFTQYCGEVPDGKDMARPQAPANVPGYAAGNAREVRGARAKASFDLGGVNLDLLGGWFDADVHNFAELNALRDGLPYTLVPGPGTVNLSTYLGNVVNTSDTSWELRFSSRNDGRLRWAAGGFLFRSSQLLQANVAVNAGPIPAGRRIVCPANLACLWSTQDGSPSADRTSGTGHTEQTSAFASLEYDLTERLTLSAEARHTKEWKDSNIASIAGAPGVDPDGPGGKDETWWFTTPRFTANFKVSDDVMLYASGAKGVKAGGFNQRASIPSEIGYDPETNWTYEIGAKNSLFDGRVRANVALFYIDWKGLQVQGPSENPNEIGFVTKNFGSVKAKGGELEVAMTVARGATVNLGLAYTNPEFQDDAFDFAGVLTCSRIPTCAPRIVTVATPQGPRQTVSLDGLQRRRSSEWQGTAMFDMSRALTGDWEWFGNATYSYTSKQYQALANYNWIGARNQLGLRAGVQRGHHRLTAWVENALDDRTPLSGGLGNIELNALVLTPLATLPDKRRFGVTLATQF
jgi:iron complex outermembrane receptor protein